MLRYFRAHPLPDPFEMTADYRIALGKVELAVLTAQSLGVGSKAVSVVPQEKDREDSEES